VIVKNSEDKYLYCMVHYDVNLHSDISKKQDLTNNISKMMVSNEEDGVHRNSDDSSMGPKRKIRFNEKLAAYKLKQALKNKDSDSGSEIEIDAKDIYDPGFHRKNAAALLQQKKLEKALERAQSPDKKDDGDSSSGSK
jgi:hypothetical protein